MQLYDSQDPRPPCQPDWDLPPEPFHWDYSGSLHESRQYWHLLNGVRTVYLHSFYNYPQ